MKVKIHIDGVIITSKQNKLMEKKLMKMKRYLPDDTLNIDLFLKDESSAEKGGIDQKVEISATFGKEKIFISETDDRMMRAFAFAMKRFERQLVRIHDKRISKSQSSGGARFEKLWGIIRKTKIRKKKSKN